MDNFKKRAVKTVFKPWFAATALLIVTALSLTLFADYAWQKVFAKLNYVSEEDTATQLDESIRNIEDQNSAILKKFKEYRETQEKSEKESKSKIPAYDKAINNILLLGIDSRDPDSIKERSDAMMILSINKQESKIKLISLQRDMLCYIPGTYNFEKLTHMNAIGGPEMTLATVNDILRLDIKKYAVVNMRKMEELIDLAGGVEIDVEEHCLNTLNYIIWAANRNFPETDPVAEVEHAGLQHLNGRQAVSYARNRTDNLGEYVGDYARMYRQRIVLQALFDRFMSIGNSRRLDMVSEAMSMVTTNLEPTEIVAIAATVLPAMNKTIDQMQVPIEGYYVSANSFAWVNLCDFNGMIPHVQEFLYGKTSSFEPVRQIPGAPGSTAVLDSYTPLVPVETDDFDVPGSESDENDKNPAELFEEDSSDSGYLPFLIDEPGTENSRQNDLSDRDRRYNFEEPGRSRDDYNPPTNSHNDQGYLPPNREPVHTTPIEPLPIEPISPVDPFAP